jgi:hypothetical protein
MYPAELTEQLIKQLHNLENCEKILRLFLDCTIYVNSDMEAKIPGFAKARTLGYKYFEEQES